MLEVGSLCSVTVLPEGVWFTSVSRPLLLTKFGLDRRKHLRYTDLYENIRPAQLAWVAGVFEGEGRFTYRTYTVAQGENK